MPKRLQQQNRNSRSDQVKKRPYNARFNRLRGPGRQPMDPALVDLLNDYIECGATGTDWVMDEGTYATLQANNPCIVNMTIGAFRNNLSRRRFTTGWN